MSSTITIGFLDRTRVCIQAEFTPPLADDEHRELLIHAALFTGRAFAALSPDRQGALAGVLREWIAARFETCPLQIVDGDPMACPQRFASTFLAPVREYALATFGCSREAGGIDYFLPMAAAAYLRYVTVADHDPEELLQPALALCAAVAIHPITLDNHFRMAAASLPKIGPVVDRTEERGQSRGDSDPAPPSRGDSDPSQRRRLPDTRRSLIVSACLAALLIVVGVQYLSTRAPKAGGETAAVRSSAKPPVPPQPPSPKALPPTPAAGGALAEGRPPAHALRPSPVMKPPSPQVRAYLRTVRDLAENSLAQVEVMLATADRERATSGDMSETLNYGTRQLQSWRQQFITLAPPPALAGQHQKVARIMVELSHIARTIEPQPAKPEAAAIRNRLSMMHGELAQILNEAEVF